MKKFIGIALILLLSSGGLSISGQGWFGVGFSVEPVMCFTDLAPRLKDLQQTSPNFRDVFNYSTGLDIEYQLESGLAFSSGINFSRKRFGFLHEESNDGGQISLWGHSEYHSLSVPVIASLVLISSSDPFFEIAPLAGISLGADYSSYRNLTRLDDNFAYTYDFDQENYELSSFLATAHAGIVFKTIIDQLGVMHWSARFSADLTKLPDFDYTVTVENNTSSFSQQIRMNYFSLSMTYYFSTWEVFNGRFLRRDF